MVIHPYDSKAVNKDVFVSYFIDALSAESDDESLSSSSEGSSSSESSSSSSSEDEEEGERADSVDSMDESTMDSTTDRYVVLIGSGVFIPESNHLMPFWCLYCCFSAFFLSFFSPSEKSCPLWLGSKEVSLKALLSTIHKLFYIPQSLIIRLVLNTQL